jgi:DNA-binding transcriptional MerR regulator
VQMIASVHEGSVPTTGDAYSVRQVARLFDLPERKLRYWSQTGFIKPSVRDEGRSFYSFRDLIAVKVAKALLDAGVPLRRVRRSLTALADRLPELASALSSLRIRCQGDRVIVEHAEGNFDAATGQLVLDFEVATLEREAASVHALPWVDSEQQEPETACAATSSRSSGADRRWTPRGSRRRSTLTCTRCSSIRSSPRRGRISAA